MWVTLLYKSINETQIVSKLRRHSMDNTTDLEFIHRLNAQAERAHQEKVEREKELYETVEVYGELTIIGNKYDKGPTSQELARMMGRTEDD
jgi:hypothetical protein